MAQHSGFFNALHIDGDYDRKYNANDYSDNLAVVISTGVLRSEKDDLKVTASGLALTVAIGRAWIQGHYYYNDTALTLPPVTAPIGGNRYDRVVLRLDKNISARAISVVYLEGTAAASPQKPAITRTETIFDLVLADVYVAASAQSLSVTDTRSDKALCGWVYSTSGDDSFFKSLDNSFLEWFQREKETLASVTLFKRYQWRTTLETEASKVAFDIPQYDPETCFIEVYVNGFFDNAHTTDGSVVTFHTALIAGTQITVNAYKSIDGTGIESVAGEITALQNAVAAIDRADKFAYLCNGVNDNVALSQIAFALYTGVYSAQEVTPAAAAYLERIGGQAFLSALPANAQVTVNVYGKCGADAPAAGNGTPSDPYQWFALGCNTGGSRRIVFDFANCESAAVSCGANTCNVLFYGDDMTVKNLSMTVASGGISCNIEGFAGANDNGDLSAENCRITVASTGSVIMGRNGTFTNCQFEIRSSANDAYCFAAQKNGLIRIFGGCFTAHTGSSSYHSAILRTQDIATDAHICAFAVAAPERTVSGYRQDYFAWGNTGLIHIFAAIADLRSDGDSIVTYL